MRLFALLLMLGCAGAAEGESRDDLQDLAPPENVGQTVDDEQPLCALSFSEAVETYAPERICQTWVYRVGESDCADWRPCSSP